MELIQFSFPSDQRSTVWQWLTDNGLKQEGMSWVNGIITTNVYVGVDDGMASLILLKYPNAKIIDR